MTPGTESLWKMAKKIESLFCNTYNHA